MVARFCIPPSAVLFLIYLFAFSASAILGGAMIFGLILVPAIVSMVVLQWRKRAPVRKTLNIGEQGGGARTQHTITANGGV